MNIRRRHKAKALRSMKAFMRRLAGVDTRLICGLGARCLKRMARTDVKAHTPCRHHGGRG